MTHYLDRNGRQTDHVAGTRWFCTQCHAPQANVAPLVTNTFVPSVAR
ncbi:MAG: nitrate reductase cytochrome c-type subunit [Pseudomonadota bacterium]